MGDRVLVTFTDDGKSHSPAIYMHWNGEDAAKMIRDAAPLFRRGDEAYSAARFCGFCHTQIEGSLGLGLLSGPKPETDWEEYSHGDAGVYIVNVSTGEVDAKGGYGKPFKLDPDKFHQG